MKGIDNMTATNEINNLDRLKMEIKGINTPDQELTIYLLENDLTDTDTYDPKSNTNKRNILKTALSILESIANDVSTMKNYKTEDISITHFHTNLTNRIDDLRRKINTMENDDLTSENDAKFIWMFK